MQEQDNLFFEEYKRLDRLCADLYDSMPGVSAYLEDMESKAETGRFHVPDWNTDYKMLKHVRWVRNRIAHDASPCRVSEAADLTFVKNFYSRILRGQDPLARLRRAAEAKKPAPRGRPARTQEQPIRTETPLQPRYYVPSPAVFPPRERPRRRGCGFAVLLIVLGLAVLVLTVYLYYTGVI